MNTEQFVPHFAFHHNLKKKLGPIHEDVNIQNGLPMLQTKIENVSYLRPLFTSLQNGFSGKQRTHFSICGYSPFSHHLFVQYNRIEILKFAREACRRSIFSARHQSCTEIDQYRKRVPTIVFRLSKIVLIETLYCSKCFGPSTEEKFTAKTCKKHNTRKTRARNA